MLPGFFALVQFQALVPTLVVLALPIVVPDEAGYARGVRARIVDATRVPASALDPAFKTANYLPNIQALRQALAAGDDEAILKNPVGLVAEGATSNVFAVIAGELLTPPLADGILPGITRKTVMEILTHEGHHCDEKMFARDAFYVAHEAFMCGTAAEITPIQSLDRRTIGDGKPGPITRMVQKLYSEGVRGRVDWLRNRITLVE